MHCLSFRGICHTAGSDPFPFSLFMRHARRLYQRLSLIFKILLQGVSITNVEQAIVLVLTLHHDSSSAGLQVDDVCGFDAISESIQLVDSVSD